MVCRPPTVKYIYDCQWFGALSHHYYGLSLSQNHLKGLENTLILAKALNLWLQREKRINCVILVPTVGPVVHRISYSCAECRHILSKIRIIAVIDYFSKFISALNLIKLNLNPCPLHKYSFLSFLLPTYNSFCFLTRLQAYTRISDLKLQNCFILRIISSICRINVVVGYNCDQSEYSGGSV